MLSTEPELYRPLPRFAQEAIADAVAALKLAAALTVYYQPHLGGRLMGMAKDAATLAPAPESRGDHAAVESGHA
jgi:hypothetical protein